MDDELYQAFITESEESITQLNNSLLELESNPEDDEAIDDIFRRAHTLKGNFGAMGFDDAATVAHAIEDLLDEVRQDRLDVTSERMDLVFEGVDLVLDILHEIERDGESTVETEGTVEAIRAAAQEADAADSADDGAAEDDVGAADGKGEGSESGDGEASDAADAPDADSERVAAAVDAVDEATLAGLDRLLHVSVRLDGGDMKGVDAGIFLSGIPDSVSVVGASPSLDAIEDGDYKDGVDLYVAGLGAKETAETFADLWSVSEATVADVSAAIERVGGETAVSEGVEERADAAGDADGGAEASDHSAADDAPAPTDASDGEAGGESATESVSESESDDSQSKESNDDDARSISAVKSVRVDVDQLDQLHELVEQLVTSRIKLRQAMGDTDADAGLDIMDELDKISSNLQNTVMDMRLIPLKKVFDKFPRLVRDLAREEEKRVDFRVTGQDIELDRTILDEISDPLMHVLRNAVDHGIEPPEAREAKGKDPQGTIELSASREHDTVVIKIEDDGKGLDVDRIREKAVEKGVATAEEVAELPDEEVFQFIFHAGFSTNDEITDVSGRGVGMDVVKTTVESLDGSVSVDSELGEGTTFRIRLPVSVAIIKVLFVEVGRQEFGVPIKYIDEISRVGRVDTINGAEVVVHEDQIFPLIRLGDALSVPEADAEDGMVVRIRPSNRQVALRCDRVTRQEEVVVTPLQGPLSGAEGLSGTSVIGDGNVIPIIDVGTLDLPEAGRRVVRENEGVAPGEAAD